MSIANNHSFTSAFPFEIKIENQFMHEGLPTIYIVNKVDEAATEQHVKLLINTLAISQHTFKGLGKNKKPTSDLYHLALAFRRGTLLQSVADSFSDTLQNAINEALKDNTCQVAGPDVQPDHSQVWYVCFEKDITSTPTQDFSLFASPLLSNDPTIEFYHITGGPDGSYYAIDTSNELYHYPPEGSQWIKYDQWGGLVKSIVAMPNRQFHYIGINNHLNPATDKPDGPWTPYDSPAILVQNNARYGASDQIGVDPSGHLIKISFSDVNPTIKVLSEKKSLISACALPNGQILGVDSHNSLHLWDPDHKTWTPINTPNHQKFLMVSVDYNNQLLAVGTDHLLYQLKLVPEAQNLLTINLKGISAEAESGTRVSQVACHFGNVHMGSPEHTFQFKSSTQINIVNHQGSGYAPLHFGVLANDVMVIGEDNTLKTYFSTHDHLPISLGEHTCFTFSFPYHEKDKQVPYFGTSSEVKAIQATNPLVLQLSSDHETVEKMAAGTFLPMHDPAGHQFVFKFQGKDLAQIEDEIFEFKNIQVSGQRRQVFVTITVENLPGYWDSVFQIPVTIGNSALTGQLDLGNALNTDSNSGSDNSRISFLSAGKNGKKPNISIEEYYGLNLFTNESLPNHPVKIRNADLLIPEGRVAIRKADIVDESDKVKPPESNNLSFPSNSKASFYVQGDSELNGHLSLHGDLNIIRSWGDGGGTKFGVDKVKGHGATDFHNLFIHADKKKETLAFQFHQRTNVKKDEDDDFKELLSIYRSGKTEVAGELQCSGLQLNYQDDKNKGTRFNWNKAYGNGATDIYNLYNNPKPNTFAFQFHQMGDNGNVKELLSIYRNGKLLLNGPVLKEKSETEIKGKEVCVSLKPEGWMKTDGTITKNLRIEDDTLVEGWMASTGTTYVQGCLQVGKKENPHERLNVDEDGNVTIGKGDLSVDGGGATVSKDAYIGGNFKVGSDTNKNKQRNATFNCNVFVMDSWVGIGTDEPLAPLHIKGESPFLTKIPDCKKYGFINSAGHGHEVDSANIPAENIAIMATGTIMSTDYSQSSDARIKKNFEHSDHKRDLETLLRLKVNNFNYIDHVQHGERLEKGLVAQEVEAIFPEAVSRHKDFIPSIYTECLDFTFNESAQTLTCRMSRPHKLVVGDQVSLTNEQNELSESEVAVVPDEHSFVLKDWNKPLERVFIYGKQVDDFRSVDYTQVSMMGISAIQALHQEVQDLKGDASVLTEQVDGLRKENVDLKLENLTLKQGYERMQEENAALKAQLMNEMRSLKAKMEALTH